MMEAVSTASIRLTMHGPPGAVRLGAFGRFLDQFQALTSAVAADRQIDGATWHVKDLQIGSAIAVATIDIPDDGPALTRDLILGVAELEQAPAIPNVYPLRAMSSVIHMAEAARWNPVQIAEEGGDTPVIPLRATVSGAVLVNARAARRETTTSLGGFYGTIELVDIRRANGKFGLRDEFTRRWVPCEAASQEILDQALSLIGGPRVYVAGEITENAARQPLRLRVQEIEPQPWAEGRSVREFRGRSGPADETAVDMIRANRDW